MLGGRCGMSDSRRSRGAGEQRIEGSAQGAVTRNGRSRPSAGIPDPGNSRPEDGVRRLPPGGDDERAVAPRRLRAGLTTVEAGALLALSGVSVIVLAALLTKGRPLSGADGLLAA